MTGHPALRRSLIAGLVTGLFLYFLAAPVGELFHRLYLSTDWEWAYVVFQILMAIGTVVPWYGFGFPVALAGGLLIMILTLLIGAIFWRRAK